MALLNKYCISINVAKLATYQKKLPILPVGDIYRKEEKRVGGVMKSCESVWEKA